MIGCDGSGYQGSGTFSSLGCQASRLGHKRFLTPQERTVRRRVIVAACLVLLVAAISASQTTVPATKPAIAAGTPGPATRQVSSSDLVGLVQAGILLLTAALVFWYAVETRRLRQRTQALVEEAQSSRKQAEAAGVVDAEMRLYKLRHLGMTWQVLEQLRTEWIRHAISEIWDTPYAPTKPGVRELLASKKSGMASVPDLLDDAQFSIEKILRITLNPSEYPGLTSARARGELDSLAAKVDSCDAETALDECELLIHLMDGDCENASPQVVRACQGSASFVRCPPEVCDRRRRLWRNVLGLPGKNRCRAKGPDPQGPPSAEAGGLAAARDGKIRWRKGVRVAIGKSRSDGKKGR